MIEDGIPYICYSKDKEYSILLNGIYNKGIKKNVLGIVDSMCAKEEDFGKIIALPVTYLPLVTISRGEIMLGVAQ